MRRISFLASAVLALVLGGCAGQAMTVNNYSPSYSWEDVRYASEGRDTRVSSAAIPSHCNSPLSSRPCSTPCGASSSGSRPISPQRPPTPARTSRSSCCSTAPMTSFPGISAACLENLVRCPEAPGSGSRRHGAMAMIRKPRCWEAPAPTASIRRLLPHSLAKPPVRCSRQPPMTMTARTPT